MDAADRIERLEDTVKILDERVLTLDKQIRILAAASLKLIDTVDKHGLAK